MGDDSWYVERVRRLLRKRDVAGLVALLTDNGVIGFQVASALAEIGPDAIPALRQAVESDDDIVTGWATVALANLNDDGADERLLAFVQQFDCSIEGELSAIWEAAVMTLGEREVRAAVEPLIGFLKCDDIDTRIAVADALALIGDRRAVGPLATLVRDEDVGTLIAAGNSIAGALEDLGGDEAEQAVAEWEVREKAWLHFAVTIERAFQPERYRLEDLLGRIDRRKTTKVFAYPGARRVPRRQEVADGPVVLVTPQDRDPWIAVFQGGREHDVPPAVNRAVITLPDGQTFCMIRRGQGICVRADDPSAWGKFGSYPITGYRAVPHAGLVVFADFTTLVAYGRDGVAWQSEELALDKLFIIRAKEETLHVWGYFGDPRGRTVPFTVNLRTGEPSGQPLDPRGV